MIRRAYLWVRRANGKFLSTLACLTAVFIITWTALTEDRESRSSLITGVLNNQSALIEKLDETLKNQNTILRLATQLEQTLREMKQVSPSPPPR